MKKCTKSYYVLSVCKNRIGHFIEHWLNYSISSLGCSLFWLILVTRPNIQWSVIYLTLKLCENYLIFVYLFYHYLDIMSNGIIEVSLIKKLLYLSLNLVHLKYDKWSLICHCKHCVSLIDVLHDDMLHMVSVIISIDKL